MEQTPSGVFFFFDVSFNEPGEAKDFPYLPPVGSFSLRTCFASFLLGGNTSFLNGRIGSSP
jgi:hypothetical protein